MNVDKAQGDASKVTAKGPGLEAAGNIANKPTYFDIYTAGSTFPLPELEIILRNLRCWTSCLLNQQQNYKISFFKCVGYISRFFKTSFSSLKSHTQS